MVAKGHHFPLLRTVGVIDADLGLRGGDLRAAERTFQLIHQVSGRAGRDGTRGVSLVQTHQPGHPVIRAILSGDGEAFRRTEAGSSQGSRRPAFRAICGRHSVGCGSRPGQSRGAGTRPECRYPSKRENRTLRSGPGPDCACAGTVSRSIPGEIGEGNPDPGKIAAMAGLGQGSVGHPNADRCRPTELPLTMSASDGQGSLLLKSRRPGWRCLSLVVAGPIVAGRERLSRARGLTPRRKPGPGFRIPKTRPWFGRASAFPYSERVRLDWKCQGPAGTRPSVSRRAEVG